MVHVPRGPASSVTETPFADDFAGVYRYMSERVGHTVVPTPFQEGFTVLD